MSSTGYWAGYSRDGGVTCRVMDRGGQAVNTLEQIAQRHLDADSWADEAMMLAAMREAVEQCANLCKSGSRMVTPEHCAAAIREWA